MEVGRKKFEDFFLSWPRVRRSCFKVIIQKADIVDRLAAIMKIIDDGIQEMIPHRAIFFSTVFYCDVDGVKDFEFFKLFTKNVLNYFLWMVAVLFVLGRRTGIH